MLVAAGCLVGFEGDLDVGWFADEIQVVRKKEEGCFVGWGGSWMKMDSCVFQ